jgi:hypothetical protein
MFSLLPPKLLVTVTYRKFGHPDIITVTTSNSLFDNNVVLTNSHYISLSQAIHKGNRKERAEADVMM